MSKDFRYSDDRFADIQMLRYRLKDFEALSLRQKILIYYLSEATLWGRDITFDQFGKYNLRIRKMLEVVFVSYQGDRKDEQFLALETYLKRIWFSNGIYHHYGCEKFVPGFTEDYLRKVLHDINYTANVDDLMPVIFNPSYLSKRVNKTDGEDLILTSACNFYDGVSQKEVEDYYNAMKSGTITEEIPSYGLNSTLCKRNGKISEDVWHSNGKYGAAIKMIVNWLEKAAGIAESEQQRKTIELLIKYYNTGILSIFDDYSIEWLQSCNERIDFVNGFIEVYGDPLGIKGSWEGIVEYKDLEATKRTQIICDNAQWFEDHSPVDSRFKKPIVRGVTANVVCAAMLGGDEYPYTAIGINLPNADWIREKYGSKSVTIGNLTEAYYLSAKNNGFYDEFVVDKETLTKIEQYGCICDDLHTDLHECLGHGSGRILAGVSADALKAYGSTIEEARADLFALYYIADQKLFELGLTPDKDAYKSQYYTYIMNGLMTQLTRIKPGHQIEEAHMRNRALIAQWCLDNGQTIKLVEKNSKTYVQIEDYCELRHLFARLLAEIQRIKSEGDYEAAKNLIERYAVKVDPVLHSEVLQRYKKLNLAPYKGFINPVMLPIKNNKGEIIDIKLDYTESYESQMLRYSRDYAALI